MCLRLANALNRDASLVLRVPQMKAQIIMNLSNKMVRMSSNSFVRHVNEVNISTL